MPFLALPEVLRLLAGVGREEGGVVRSLAHGQGDEALLGELELAPLGDQDLGRDLLLGRAHRLVHVERQVLDRAAALRADDVRAPAVLGEAVGRAGVANAKTALPHRYFSWLLGDALLVVERLDRDGLLAVGQAEQEARHDQADVARVLGLAERAPLGVLRPLEDRLQVLEVGQACRSPPRRRTSGRPRR